MEFDIDMALKEHFAPMPSQDPPAFAGTVPWDRVHSAVEKLKRRIIPRDVLLQQNRNYKKMLKEYDNKIRIVTKEHQAILLEKTNTSEKYLISEMVCEKEKLKVKDMEENNNKANLSINALNANIRQLEELIEKKDAEILGLQTELKLQQLDKPPDVASKKRGNKVLLRHLHMFAEAAKKRDGLNFTLKRILKTYNNKEKDTLEESDMDEDCINNHIYTGPQSVDTGRGSSLASSDEEKVELSKTTFDCNEVVDDGPIFSPSSSTPVACVLSDVVSQKSTRDTGTSPIRVCYKEVSTSPIRAVDLKYIQSESKDDVFELIKALHTNIVPTSPMPIEPQDSFCPCGRECILTNNYRKPIQKLKFKSKTKTKERKLIEKKNNKITLRTALMSHIDQQIKSQLERELKKKEDEQKSSDISQAATKDSVSYSSEQVAHLLLAMGRAQNFLHGEQESGTERLRRHPAIPRPACKDNIQTSTTQDVIHQTPETLKLKSVYDFEVKSLKDRTPENKDEENNYFFAKKISCAESSNIKTVLIEEDNRSLFVSGGEPGELLTDSTQPGSKRRLARKQPLRKLENLRNKLSRKCSGTNCAESSPPKKRTKIKSSCNESHLSASENIECTPALQNSLDAYRKAVKVMTQFNNKKNNKVRIEKIGLPIVKHDKNPIGISADKDCHSMRPLNANIVRSDLKRKKTDTSQIISKLCKTKSKALIQVCTPNVQVTTAEKLSCHFLNNSQLMTREHPMVRNPAAMVKEESSFNTKNDKVPDLMKSPATCFTTDIDSTKSTFNNEQPTPMSYQDLNRFDDKVEPAPVNAKGNAYTHFSPSTSTTPYFLQIIERYAKKKRRIMIVANESVNAKLVEQITKYVSSAIKQSSEKAHKTLDKLMERLQKEKYKAVIRAFIEWLSNQRESELDYQLDVDAPPTTASERAALYCMQRVLRHWPELPVLDTFLDSIEFKLFRLGAAPSCRHVENLSRFYALLCRITKDIGRLRIFVTDAIYCLTVKSIFAVMSVLDVWCHVLPLAQQPLASDPLVVSIVHLLHFTQGKNEIMYKMRVRLFRKFGYQPGECNQQEMLAKLDSFMRDQEIMKTKHSLYVAFLLVGKRYGTAWCHTHLLKGMLLPLLDERGVTARECHARALAARLLGPLARPFPAEMNMQSQLIRHRLIEMILREVEVEVELGALQSALVLCTGVLLDSLLATWRPRITPPLALRAQLRRHAQQATLQAWQKKYTLKLEDACT